MEESLEKLAASKSRRQRGAVVHNYAHEHELQHTLRTYDTMKTKAVRSLDFEQRKFLQSLSLSTEDVRRIMEERSPGAARKKPKAAAVAPSNGDHFHLGALTGSHDDLSGAPDKQLPRPPSRIERSASDLDLRNLQRMQLSPRPVLPLERSRTFSASPDAFSGYSPRTQRRTRPRKASDSSQDSSAEDKDQSESPREYSICCSMKIADSRGAFESWTGKKGLRAWMGKESFSSKAHGRRFKDGK